MSAYQLCHRCSVFMTLICCNYCINAFICAGDNKMFVYLILSYLCLFKQTAPQTRPCPHPRPPPRPGQRSQRNGNPTRGTQRQGANRNSMLSARGTRHEPAYGSADTDTFASAAFWRRAREKANISHENREIDTKRFPLIRSNEQSKSHEKDCYEKCGEAYHLTINCFHQQAIQCHDCQMVGHKSKLCSYYH